MYPETAFFLPPTVTRLPGVVFKGSRFAVVDRLLKYFQTPRLWLTAGAVCLAASVLLGYHEDQVAADSVMADKVPSPSAAFIQNYDPATHSNILREVRLLGEVAFGQSTRVNVGSETAPKMVEVVPVYAVSEVSAPIAAATLAGEGAPVAGPAIVGMEDNTPLALAVSEGLAENFLIPLGKGRNGPLVSLFGATIGNGEVFQATARALARDGVSLMPGMPVVWLYPGGTRPHATSKDYSTLRQMLDMLVIAMVLTGGLLAVLPSRPKRPAPESFQEVPAVGEFPGVFATKRDHDEERIRDEQDASERQAARTRRVLSRIHHRSA